MHKFWQLLVISFFFINVMHADKQVDSQNKNKRVYKFTLENGLTVIVVPVKHASQVSAQMWYKVGSKHEVAGERGMAHFIEHMVFKGTDNLLAESDIMQVSNKLSASLNAGTWYDFTMYYFTLPLANWDKVLPIFADCMQYCSFKQDHMSSEVKAVIQELKMYNDMYDRILPEMVASTIFDSHPYHYSVIGFKEDLWNLKRETLVDFYKKHYVPHNATLVLVGNLDPQVAFEKVTDIFGHIPRGLDIPVQDFYINKDIRSTSVTVHRDLEQPIGMLAFVVPGRNKKVDHALNVLDHLLLNGKSSRLYKRLVEDEKLVYNVYANDFGTIDCEMFHIIFEPKNDADFEKIKNIVLEELTSLSHHIPDKEMQRAVKRTYLGYQKMFESVELLGSALGLSYLATGDEEHLFTDIRTMQEELKKQIQEILQNDCKPSLCHEGRMRKLADKDKGYLEKLQKESAKLDAAALMARERETKVEPPRYAHKVVPAKYQKKSFDKPEVVVLSNGLKVLLSHNSDVDTVDCILKLKFDQKYVPEKYDGLCSLLFNMMLEGTQKYPGAIFAEKLESAGIFLNISDDDRLYCHMLSSDIVLGFEFMRSAVQEATFDTGAFIRLQDKHLAAIKDLEDDLDRKAYAVARKIVYNKRYPFASTGLGSEESVTSIDRNLCYEFYKKYSSPYGAYLVVTGNFDPTTIKQQLEQAFSSWRGVKIDDVLLPESSPVKPSLTVLEKNKDQVCLAFTGLSKTIHDPDYIPLLIFDKILTGGSAGGMDTLLFKVREKTGLFYSYKGSLLQNRDPYDNMYFVCTAVAKDRVQEAHDVFVDVLLYGIDDITEEQFELAKEAIVNRCPLRYETNGKRAATFAMLEDFHLPYDYFEVLVDRVRSTTKQEMVTAVKKVLQKDNMSFIKIGKWLDKGKD